jgi:FMN-dependent NADH-azoreductase
MKVLHIISSSRGEASVSLKLGNAIIEKIKFKNPDSTVKVRDLTKTVFPHLEEAHIQSFFTKPEDRTPEQQLAVAHSDEAIDELFDADAIVIGVPMYNFSIPSTLKTWIDHIARVGKTFTVNENGLVGLIQGKKVYLAIASGNVYTSGPYVAYDHTENYLKIILGFVGLTDVTVYRAEGLTIPDLKETALEKAIDAVEV